MDRIRIVGGKPLHGGIPISGAKNATLPLMVASLLTDDTLVLENVPRLGDVTQLQHILSTHGVDNMVHGKRMGEAKVSLPGGCAIGTRPVDLLIMALERLGAKIESDGGYVIARAKSGLK